MSCFENSNYITQTGESNQKDHYDDDPMYELLSCHKVTFIEELLADHLNRFKDCKFANEDLEDFIKA